jgi:diguanylate cyclase (GGDEF)-like protein
MNRLQYPLVFIALSLSFATTALADHCPVLIEEAEAIAALRDSDPQEGVARGEAVLADLAGRHECTVEEARVRGAIGTNLNILGRNEEAAAQIATALESAEALSDRDLALLHRGAGLAQYDLGEFDAAISHYLVSLEASERAGDSVEAAKTAGNIGILYTTLGQLERANEFYTQALDGFTDAGFTPGVAGILINLGALAARQGETADDADDAEQARAHHEDLRDYNLRAMELFVELGNQRGVTYAAANVGLAWDRLGDPGRALEFHRRALEIRREIGDVYGTINSLVTTAASLTSLARYDEAEAMLEEAYDMLPEGNPTLRLSVVRPWVTLAEARDDLQEALRLQRQVAALRSEIADEDHRARVSEIETRYQSEQLRRQVSDLELGQALADEQLQRQQQRTVAAGVIVLLLLALVAALFARYRLKLQSQLALEQAARTDELTGLANRRHMRERVEYEMQRSRRTGRVFSVGVIDLDEFKEINDTHGHAVGDKALVTVTERIQNMLRRQDTLARWGGDELLMLLPETDEAGATALARKLVAEFEENQLSIDGKNIRVTLTIGIAQYWPGMDMDQCLQCADDAMYTGKRQGRSQVQAKRP